MASIIGALRVTLGLDSAGFETGALRAEKRAKSMGNEAEALGYKVGRMGKAVIAAGAAVAGSAVFSAVAGLIKQGLEYASALGEQAQQLGVTTKALQEYRYAATQVGIEQDEMDAALGKLTRTMGEAAQGAKGPADAFAKLGIDIKAFVASGKDAGDLIPLIAEGMGKLGSDSDRAATAVDLFGKSGQQLLPLLSDGAKGVNDFRQAARDLGIVLDDAMIKKADDAADKMAALQTFMQAKLAITVANNADKLIKMAEAMEKLISWASKLYDMLDRFNDSKIGRAMAAISNIANLATPGGLTASVAGAALDAAMKADGARPAGAGGGAGGGAPAAAKWPTGPVTAGRFSLPGKTNFAGAGFGIESSFARMVSGQQGRMKGLLDAFDEAIPVFDKAKDALEALNQAQEMVTQNALGMKRQVKDTATTMKSSFVDAANGIIGSLNQLSSAFSGGGGFLGKISAILGFGLQLGGIGAFGSKIAANINGARAMGGPVNAGGMYKVGERGPEYFVPNSAGRIIPNGGGETRISVEASPFFDVRVNGQIQRAAPIIASAGAEGGLRRMRYAQSRSLAR